MHMDYCASIEVFYYFEKKREGLKNISVVLAEAKYKVYLEVYFLYSTVLNVFLPL